MITLVYTRGLHQSTTKFYEIVALYNPDNYRCVIVQRNGKADLSDVVGGGQCRLLFIGDLDAGVRRFDEQVRKKSEYDLSLWSFAEAINGLSDEAVREILTACRIAIPDSDELWDGFSGRCVTPEEASAQSVEFELPSAIPAQYGGW